MCGSLRLLLLPLSRTRTEVPPTTTAILAHNDVLQHLRQVHESKGLANETINLCRTHFIHDHLPAVSTGNNDPDVRPHSCSLRNHLRGRRPRDSHIKQNQVNIAAVCAQPVDCSRSVRSFVYFKTLPTQYLHDGLPERIFILHNQHRELMSLLCRLVAAGHRVERGSSCCFGGRQ